jgi:hypothetical protein
VDRQAGAADDGFAGEDLGIACIACEKDRIDAAGAVADDVLAVVGGVGFGEGDGEGERGGGGGDHETHETHERGGQPARKAGRKRTQRTRSTRSECRLEICEFSVANTPVGSEAGHRETRQIREQEARSLGHERTQRTQRGEAAISADRGCGRRPSRSAGERSRGCGWCFAHSRAPKSPQPVRILTDCTAGNAEGGHHGFHGGHGSEPASRDDSPIRVIGVIRGQETKDPTVL